DSRENAPAIWLSEADAGREAQDPGTQLGRALQAQSDRTDRAIMRCECAESVHGVPGKLRALDPQRVEDAARVPGIYSRQFRDCKEDVRGMGTGTSETHALRLVAYR